MPKRRDSELTTGLFVLLSLAVLVGLVLWLGAADLWIWKQGRRAARQLTREVGDAVASALQGQKKGTDRLQ